MPTHQFVISSQIAARGTQVYDVAQCGDLIAKSLKSCSARKLARDLIAAGAEDGPIEARGTDGKLRYTVKSLAAFAKFTTQENPRIKVVRWTEHPHARDQDEAA
jgi:hypothetical protein